MLQNQGDGGLNLNVNLAEAETTVCECGSRLYQQEFLLKKIPKVMIGAPSDVPVPIPVWRCTDCGRVNKDFIPRAVGTFEKLFGIETLE